MYKQSEPVTEVYPFPRNYQDSLLDALGLTVQASQFSLSSAKSSIANKLEEQ